jgi:hypothetical protein
MNDTRLAAGDLIRTLIRAVDAADQNAIAALTATDVHFRFGNADRPTPNPNFSRQQSRFAMRLPICTTPSSTSGTSVTARSSR